MGQFVPRRSNLLLPPNESAEGKNVSLERNSVRRAVNEVSSFPREWQAIPVLSSSRSLVRFTRQDIIIVMAELGKPPSFPLLCLAPLHPSSPPPPRDSGLSTPLVCQGPAFSVSFRLKNSIQEKEKDEPQASDLRRRRESRTTELMSGPAPG